MPGSSAGKKSTCNARDPGLIPGSGRFTGEGTGYSLQYSWASLVAQLVKNPPAMQETWVRSLGWDTAVDPEHGAQAASPFLPRRPPACTVSSLEGGRHISPHLRVILSLLETDTEVNDLQFFCMENLSFLPFSFFIQSFIYISIDSRAFVSYFGLYSDTILIICCLKYDR